MPTATTTSTAPPVPWTEYFFGDNRHFNGWRHDYLTFPHLEITCGKMCKACELKFFPTATLSFTDRKKSLGMCEKFTCLFILGEMAGYSLLIAPWVFVNFGLLMGILMWVLFLAASGHCVNCISWCWFICKRLRTSDFLNCPFNSPYENMAFTIFGNEIRRKVAFCMGITLFCAATVCLKLIAQCADRVMYKEGQFYLLAILLSSLMIIDDPKALTFVSFGSLITSTLACLFLIMQILLDWKVKGGIDMSQAPLVELNPINVPMSLGMLMFISGASSVLPVIQNPKYKRFDNPICLVFLFTLLSVFFMAVVFLAYFIYGKDIQPNILMSMDNTWWSYIAAVMSLCHQCFSFVIFTAPLSKQCDSLFADDDEEISDPPKPTLRRYFVGVGLLIAMILTGLIIDDLSCLVVLFGGSSMFIGAFVLPCVFYLLISKHRFRTIDIAEKYCMTLERKIAIYTIITVGSVCSIVSMTAGTYKTCQIIIPRIIDFFNNLNFSDLLHEYII